MSARRCPGQPVSVGELAAVRFVSRVEACAAHGAQMPFGAGPCHVAQQIDGCTVAEPPIFGAGIADKSAG